MTYSIPSFSASSSSLEPQSSRSLGLTTPLEDHTRAQSAQATQYTQLPHFFRDASKHSGPAGTVAPGIGYGHTWKSSSEISDHGISAPTWFALQEYYGEWVDLWAFSRKEFPMKLDSLTPQQRAGVEDCLGNMYHLFEQKVFCHFWNSYGWPDLQEVGSPEARFMPFIWLQGEPRPVPLAWEHILGAQLFASREENSTFSFALTPSGTIIGILSHDTMMRYVYREKGLRDLENKRSTYKAFASLQDSRRHVNVPGYLHENTIHNSQPDLDVTIILFEELASTHSLDIWQWFKLGYMAAAIDPTALEQCTSRAPSTRKRKREEEHPALPMEEDASQALARQASGSAPYGTPPSPRAPLSKKQKKSCPFPLSWQPVNQDIERLAAKEDS